MAADHQSRAYGEANPELTYTITGFVDGKTQSDVAGKAALSTTATETSPVGNDYAITVDDISQLSLANYTFAKQDNTLEITKASEKKNAVTATGYSGTYDGKAHDAVTSYRSAVTEGTTYKFSTDGGKTWVDTMPTQTNVVTDGVVSVKAINANYEDATADVKVTIAKRVVTLTSGSATKVSDGTALTNSEMTVAGDGFVTGEGAAYAFTGTQTVEGSSKNTFTYVLNAGTTAGNYNITLVEGTLTVTAARPVLPGTNDDDNKPTPAPTNDRPSMPTTTDRPSTPKTSDSTNAPLAAGAMAFSMLLAGFAFILKKKYSR